MNMVGDGGDEIGLDDTLCLQSAAISTHTDTSSSGHPNAKTTLSLSGLCGEFGNTSLARHDFV